MTTKTWAGRVFIGASLDGYIARHDGDIAWLTDPPQGRSHAEIDSSAHAQTWDTFFPTIDHIVMGRGTYQKVLTFGEWPFDGTSVIVMSTTLADDDPRIAVAREVSDAVARLNAQGASQVYVDGGRVIQAFLRAGLVDELTIGWAPVLIGSGLPLFGALGDDVHLTLVGTHATEGGMVHVTYRVERVGLGGPQD